MTDLDLFGLAAGPMLTPKQRRKIRPRYKENGYAKPPGSGPQGETCKSCAQIRRLGVAQLGSAGVLDETEFRRRIVDLALRKSTPRALRSSASVCKDEKHHAYPVSTHSHYI